jgi:hypothetical protein
MLMQLPRHSKFQIFLARLIVAFGQEVYDLLQFALAGMGIRIRQVWHYSYTRRGPEKPEAFERQIKEVLELEGLTIRSSRPSPGDSAAELRR